MDDATALRYERRNTMEPRYFPYDGNPYRPKTGLTPLDLKDWVEIDDKWEEQLALKVQLLSDRRDVVLRLLPEAAAGALELRKVLSTHLAETFPQQYRLQGETLTVGKRQFAAPRDGEEAMFQVGAWTQEDWALLGGPGIPKLIAGSICFPSRWKIGDKIGLDPRAIHAPVPKFDTIAAPTERFLERIVVGHPVWRLNWTIHDSNELHVPDPHPSADDLSEENILERSFVRFERQTLRRLPETQVVVFSIRTYMYRVRDIAEDATRRAKLLGTIEGLDGDSARYKGMAAFHPLLVSALRAASA